MDEHHENIPNASAGFNLRVEHRLALEPDNRDLTEAYIAALFAMQRLAKMIDKPKP